MRQIQLENLVPSVENVSPLFKKHYPLPRFHIAKCGKSFILMDSLR